MFIVRMSPESKIPCKKTPESAGYDLSSSENVIVPPRGRALVPTGLCFQVPESTYGRIAPRSGLALKNGIDVGAGVIDRDYTGFVGVILFNHTDEAFEVNIGDRIAQLIVTVIHSPQIIEVKTLNETTRMDGGFGSTGLQ